MALKALQRDPIFRFFASLQLAMILLSVLIIAGAVGTIYESRMSTEVARAYIYNTWWFDIWLAFLALNLFAVTISRLPWKKRHVGFVITHYGIIILLIGSWVDRMWGVEGSLTLFEGQEPSTMMLINEKELRVGRVDNVTGSPLSVRAYPVDIIHRKPTLNYPLPVGEYHLGGVLWHFDAIGYANHLEGIFDPKPSNSGGSPAVKVLLQTKMMGQDIEQWVWSGSPDRASMDFGLAKVELVEGQLPDMLEDKADGKVAIVEKIFAFANVPDQQVAKAMVGGSTGAKLKLELAGKAKKDLKLTLNYQNKKQVFTASNGKFQEWKVKGTDFTIRIDHYWPHFQIANGKPTSESDEPVNPAVEVTIKGKGIPIEESPHAGHGAGGPPSMASMKNNLFKIFYQEDGSMGYVVTGRKGSKKGPIAIGRPVETGWADWTITVKEVMPQARSFVKFTPFKPQAAQDYAKIKTMPSGLLVRTINTEKPEETYDDWVAQGWIVSRPTDTGMFRLTYGYRQYSLPFGLQLQDFEVTFNEGTLSPATFASTLKVHAKDGSTAVGTCSMNVPFNYPEGWWGFLSGDTYKMSQASWNPEDHSQSSVQILRDPGWFPKWFGSLLICVGIFCLFYLRPVSGDLKPKKAVASE